jgi:DnaK suppressor protein
LIEKIRDALDRLEDGTFGICEGCGEEIPLKRLMARPVTTLCFACKKAQEAEERTRMEGFQVPHY